jgi:imidazolonepropionase-like amidohydrolase
VKITSWVVLAFFCFGASAHAADELVVLKAARMFDGKSNSLLQNGAVIVKDDKIMDAGTNLQIPEGARVIDLGDATLCPGFIDAHTHLTEDFSGNYNERRLRELDLNVSEQAIQATEYARVTVEAGFTTVATWAGRFVASHELSTWRSGIQSTNT